MRFESEYKEKWKTQTAFIMMPFKSNSEYDDVVSAIKERLSKYGIHAVRADDWTFCDESLFKNIEVYMHCAEFGIAIFDSITQDEINPNVSLEMGYMLGLGKKVLLLKENRLKKLQSDLMGRLYCEFDSRNIKPSISNIIDVWVEQNKFGNKCCGFTIVTSGTLPSSQEEIAEIIEPIYTLLRGKFGEAIDYPKVVFSGPKARNIGLHFQCGNYSIAREVLTNIKELESQSHSKAKFSSCEIPGEDPYSDGIINGNVAICQRSHFRGYQDLFQEAKNHLGNNVFDVNETKVFISKTIDGNVYYQTNYVVPGNAFPTKAYTTIECGGRVLDILPMMYHGLNHKPNILDLHINRVQYFISKKILPELKIGDAKHVIFLD